MLLGVRTLLNLEFFELCSDLLLLLIVQFVIAAESLHLAFNHAVVKPLAVLGRDLTRWPAKAGTTARASPALARAPSSALAPLAAIGPSFTALLPGSALTTPLPPGAAFAPIYAFSSLLVRSRLRGLDRRIIVVVTVPPTTRPTACVLGQSR
jgi:hypothetical protein